MDYRASLYSKDKGIEWEELYMSKSVTRRLRRLRYQIDYSGFTVADLARYLRSLHFKCNPAHIRNWYSGIQHPSLAIYLTLAGIFNWDLSRDVNYAYANVLYTPSDIKSRLLRIFGGNMPLRSIIKILSAQSSNKGHWYYVEHSLSYGIHRSLKLYGKYMRLISIFEQALGFADALDFEP